MTVDRSTPEFKARKAAYDKARRLADPDRKKAADRAWYEANRERNRARAKAWAEANRDRMAAFTMAWRDRNRDAYRAACRTYYRENPEKFAATQQRYRAAKKAGGGDVSEQQWSAIVEEFDGRCAYCNTAGMPLEMEHMTPLSRGGSHHPDNVVPACMPCNRRKGRLTALEFLSRALTSQKGDSA